MIHVDRTGLTAPAVLAAGAAELPELEVRARERTLGAEHFKAAIYAADDVKRTLWATQHTKCCFCERAYERSWASVEHFRPKTRARRAAAPLDVGYWWLAYDFDNLHFACMHCNRWKSDWFPLAVGAEPLPPAASPQAHDEQPLLLDPSTDDPEEHLAFVELPGGRYQIAPRNGSLRGLETTRRIGLDRDDLTELRCRYAVKHITPLVERFRAAKARDDLEAEETVRREARQLSRPDAEFALLARSIFRQHGLLSPTARMGTAGSTATVGSEEA